MPGSSKLFLPFSFATKMYEFLFFPIRTTFSAHIIHLITLITSPCAVVFILLLLWPSEVQIFFSVPCAQTLCLCSSFTVRYQFLHIFIFR
jgi:hypothetical protein